jgi:hypothetical protein
MPEGSRPTHWIVVTHKRTKQWYVVGAAWEHEWGTGIVLNPGTVLDWRMCKEYYITFKPIPGDSRKEAPPVEPKPSVGVIVEQWPPKQSGTRD